MSVPSSYPCKSNNICSICIVNKCTVALKQCQHKFCMTCISIWTKKNNNCPMCRTVLKEEQSNTHIKPRRPPGSAFAIFAMDKDNREIAKTYLNVTKSRKYTSRDISKELRRAWCKLSVIDKKPYYDQLDISLEKYALDLQKYYDLNKNEQEGEFTS